MKITEDYALGFSISFQEDETQTAKITIPYDKQLFEKELEVGDRIEINITTNHFNYKGHAFINKFDVLEDGKIFSLYVRSTSIKQTLLK